MAVVAARQGRLSAFRRCAGARRQRTLLTAIRGPVVALIVGLLGAGALGIAGSAPASAQGFTYNPVPVRRWRSSAVSAGAGSGCR